MSLAICLLWHYHFCLPTAPWRLTLRRSIWRFDHGYVTSVAPPMVRNMNSNCTLVDTTRRRNSGVNSATTVHISEENWGVSWIKTSPTNIEEVGNCIQPFQALITWQFVTSQWPAVLVFRYGATGSTIGMKHGCWKCCDVATLSLSISGHLYVVHNIKLDRKMQVYECTQCSYRTTHRNRFQDHERWHRDVRDINCPHCDKKFTTMTSQRGHIKAVHKPKHLKCVYCSYASSLVSQLKTHMRVMHTHPNHKPFKCVHCDFHCATSGNCRKHIMQRHKGLEVKWIKVAEKTPAAAADPQWFDSGSQLLGLGNWWGRCGTKGMSAISSWWARLQLNGCAVCGL